MSRIDANSSDPFEARRRRVGALMAALAIGVYALLSIIFVNRLITQFTLNHVSDLLYMLVCLAANTAALGWQRRGRPTLSAATYMLANSVVLVIFVITSPSTNALTGLVVALGMAAYASAVLPRRRVALGTLYGFGSGALIATLDYIQPWRHGRLNFSLADPAQLVLLGLGVVFVVLLVNLYRGVALNAKLLLAGGGLALLGVVVVFIPVYIIIQRLPSALMDYGAQVEGALVVASAVGVVAVALLSQVIARSILRPLQTVAAASARIAEGDLNALHQPTPRGPTFDERLRRLEQESQDETSDLVRSFRGMTGRLQQLTAGLEQNVAELGNAKQLIQVQFEQLQAQTEELQGQYEHLQAQTQALSKQENALVQAEAELRRLNTELEQRVTDRTGDLNRANAELARAVRAKDEFLAAMSHDLRSPLNAILISVATLEDGVYGALTTEQVRSLQAITESGQHLLALINDILDVAKTGAGKLDLALAPILVTEVCESALRLVREVALKKRLGLAAQFDPQVTTLVADERRFKQILVNLLSNAVKFTPEGGEIGLTVCADPEAQRVRFTVWDTGVGIAPADLSRLFQPFVQLDNALTREQPGSGLGLSLVRGLVELHGGAVSVESAVHQGSRFTVSLPWSPLAASAQPAQLAERPAVATVAAGQDQLILLAEDSELALPTLSAFLQARGYRVLVARNGLEAIDAATRHPVDLVLMDIQMPKLDGLEATRYLRARSATARLPIIALTALAMPGDRERCLEAGVDAYLPKPVNLRELMATITGLLPAGDGRRLADEQRAASPVSGG